MGLSDKLRRLDEKTGLKPRFEGPQERWRWGLRHWWVNIAVGAVVLLLAEVAVIAWDVQVHPISFVVIGLTTFMSGFLYAERLRQLNRKSALPALRIPDEGLKDPQDSNEINSETKNEETHE